MVSIDGELLGTAPDTFAEIAPGPHKLEFTKENYAPVSKSVNVTAGQTVQMSVFLAFIEPVPTQSPGFTGILAMVALGIGALVGMRRR
jgi:PGF-CTERM protein